MLVWSHGARLLLDYGAEQVKIGSLMNTMPLGIAVSLLVVVSGCATDPGDPCMRRVAGFVKPAAAGSGAASFETRLPAAQSLFEDASFGNARWTVIDVSRASLILPTKAFYAVTLPGDEESARGDRKDVCDLSRTYLVVRDGGMGDPQRAFGPLSQSR